MCQEKYGVNGNFKESAKTAFLGKSHTEETKKKMSESAKGKHDSDKNSQYGTMWITNGIQNKKIKKDDIIPEGWYKGRTMWNVV